MALRLTMGAVGCRSEGAWVRTETMIPGNLGRHAALRCGWIAVAALFMGEPAGSTGSWPKHAWPAAAPASVGLDQRVREPLDADIAAGKYGPVDSFEVFRCGDEVFSRKYTHDYAKLYGKEAKTKGPLNARLTGCYNYFDPAWHPYYHSTGL